MTVNQIIEDFNKDLPACEICKYTFLKYRIKATEMFNKQIYVKPVKI